MEHIIHTSRTPGQLLSAALEARGWTQRVLSAVTGVEPGTINKIATDKREITAELALVLEEALGVEAATFLQVQTDFQLAKARFSARPDKKRALRAAIFAAIPVGEMLNRGWLDSADLKDIEAVETSLVKFFNGKSLESIEFLSRLTNNANSTSDITPAQLAWLYRAQRIAEEMVVGSFSEHSCKRAIKLLQPLTSAAEEVRKIPRILAECGIRFLVVEALSRTGIDGACFWLDRRSPVVALTLRQDRIDNFWFALRHELEHVRLGHGLDAPIIDVGLGCETAAAGKVVSESEHLANVAALEFCVPQKSMDSFIARKEPFFAERDLLGMAATLKVHPGLVAGQLQHRTGQYHRFKTHLVKVRALVTPSAIVDGWGDVAPTQS